MPKIPRINPGKAIPRSVAFPNQMWMRTERRGANGWKQLGPDERIIARKDWPVTHHHVSSHYPYPGSNFIETENWEPVQGPEMPMLLEYRRQYLRNAQEAFDRDLAEEMARQAYNRRVAGWNSYSQLPRRERQFWANQDAIEDYLYSMGYASAPRARLAVRNPEALDRWAKENWNMDEYPYGDAEEFESFDEFPEVTGNIPWRR